MDLHIMTRQIRTDWRMIMQGTRRLIATALWPALALSGLLLLQPQAGAQTPEAPPAAPTAGAGPGTPPLPAGHACLPGRRRGAAWMHRYGITAQQRARIQGIVQQSRQRQAPLLHELFTLRRREHALFTAPQVDATALLNLQQERNQIVASLATQAMQTRVEIAEQLSPRQRREMADAWQRRAQRMRRWGHFDRG